MDELDDFIPQLYRCLALYLQVMRQGLLPAVEQACFHLATQINPLHYARVGPLQRRHFHRRLTRLVRRTSSLLTVEQLANLASRLHAEHGLQRQEQQHRLIDGLPDHTGTDDTLPPGSIHLDLQPPIAFVPSSWAGMVSTVVRHDDDNGDRLSLNEAHGSDHDANDPDDDGEELDVAEVSSRLLEAFAMAIGAAMFGDGDPEPSPSPWEDGRLPRQPLLLLQWLEWFEHAITRRLRNLSHSINVELTQVGLCSSLLPMGVLDAVIEGQIESHGGPANLLRLDVPLSIEIATGQLQMSAVLLRSIDLEMEQPKLRTCRHRLLQKRQELRRMADQYRRLERRRQISEAERLWLQDQRATRQTGP
ncbi:MAG: hypothetical protein VKN13_00295 [Cyanobacteriota bacterium]|nr:hypothetical protein [Cyanobacteriota bacterium]